MPQYMQDMEMDEDQDLAASRMAAAQRGKKARQEAAEQKNAATKVAAAQRGKGQRKKAAEEQRAATVIQSRSRGQRDRGQKKEGQRYYTPAEVSAHDTASSLWVSSFGLVYDLTLLVTENPGHLVQPIIDAAGTDISHWFDPVTKQVRTYIDPETEFEVPFTPMGVFLHCPPSSPTTDWSSNFGKPWWKDKAYAIGKLTQKTRKVNLYNMLTKQETILEVCTEETLEEIQKRYLAYNGHSASYTWKRTDSNSVARLLNMRGTLLENGIPDESLQFDMLNIDEDAFIPTIHLYFSDDLSIA